MKNGELWKTFLSFIIKNVTNYFQLIIKTVITFWQRSFCPSNCFRLYDIVRLRGLKINYLRERREYNTIIRNFTQRQRKTSYENERRIWRHIVIVRSLTVSWLYIDFVVKVKFVYEKHNSLSLRKVSNYKSLRISKAKYSPIFLRVSEVAKIVWPRAARLV